MKQIPLRRRDGSVCGYAIVDDVDYDALCAYRWSSGAAGRPRRTENCRRWEGGRTSRTIYMAQQIMEFPARQVDHRNGDVRDNRRSNLRLATNGENQQNVGVCATNRSGYRGVDVVNGRWRARVMLDGKRHNLGAFDSAEQADRVAAAFRARHMPFSPEAA